MTIQPDPASPETTGAQGPGTIPGMLDHAIKLYDSKIAMKSHHAWGYQSLTFQEFGRLAGFLGAGLIASGLEKGDRVALIADNSPEWTLVYAAVTSCGAIVVPLDTQLKENEIRHLLFHSDSRFLVTSPRIYDQKIEGMNLEGVVVIIAGDVESQGAFVTIGEVMALGKERITGGEDQFTRRKGSVGPDDTAAICYTSGTTGQPKGAVLLHRNLCANVEGSRRRVQFTSDDIFLSLLPLHHTFAATCNFLAPFSTGSTIIFGRSLKSSDIRDDIAREEVTILAGVPLLFEHMASTIRKKLDAAPGSRKLLFNVISGVASGLGRLLGKNLGKTVFKSKLRESGLGSIRICISGAAALRADVEDILTSLGIKILQGYGMTEASPVIAVNPVDKPRKGTVGPPLDGVRVEIDRPNDEGIGEIVVTGPNVMKEYFKNPEATGEALRDGRLFTGDLGRVDRDGYLTIAGRKKSVIVTAGGKNIYPDEIEVLLGQSPYILECMVLAVRDRKGNDSLGAIIVPDYNTIGTSPQMESGRTEEDIRSLIANEIKSAVGDLPRFKHIAEFQIRDMELPKTTTKKLRRHLVKWIEE